MFNLQSLQPLFCPQSVAVVGASATLRKIGAVPVSLLRRFGYAGEIFPINPRAGVIQELQAYPSIEAIGRPVDLAILAVPAALACGAMEDAARARVRSVAVFTSGYAETGEAGRADQERMARLAAENGIRLLGPNCLGFMNIRENVYATFTPAPQAGAVRPGSIGLVSQSGAFGAYAYCLARERGLGLSYWISTGNEGDVDVADCIAWLVNDPATRVIMAYMEGCKNGEKLKQALAMAQAAGKPVVVTKVGRTGSGAQAAASHTAALAGDDVVYDAVFRRYGVLRAYTVEEFFNIGYALDVCGVPPASRNLAILTISGGAGALMADDAEDARLNLPALSEGAQQKILARIPFAGPRNPIDITGQLTSEPELLPFAAGLAAADGQYGSLLVFLAASGTSAAMWPHFRAFAENQRSAYPAMPLVMCSLFAAEHRRELEALGCLVFVDPSAAVKTLGAIAGLPGARIADSNPAHVQEASLNRALLPDGPLTEAAALKVLQNAGVPAMPFSVARSEEEAVAAAENFTYPVVLKIVSADILHKSDIGGVALSLGNAEMVRHAYRRIHASVAMHAPGAAVEGILVAPMVSGGVECILGIQRDPVFGPVIMFGLGGIFVEILKDVSFRLAPVGREEALEMIDEVQAAALLKGARGRPVADIEALAAAMVALSAFAAISKDRIASIDINPFVVLPEGRGAMALDAVIVPS